MLSAQLQAEIRRGLLERPRRLPSSLLYDDLGSVLFEAITFLPEYGLTRADTALLEAHAGDYFASLAGSVELVELGPGSGRKAAVLLRALLLRQPLARFVGVDVSAEALEATKRTLERVQGVSVEVQCATYLEGLARTQRVATTRLVCFLGSNLSNFDRAEAAAFFREVHGVLRPGDALLVAADLEKPERDLLPAYDDALGVTAAFNRNVLVRLQREAQSTVPLDAFVHRAVWNATERRIEMHLVATREVIGEVLGVPVRLSPQETLWTESSHRFSKDELQNWALEAGFRRARVEVGTPWAFAHVLAVV